MPFTFVHPVAVLPWLRPPRRLSATGLVAGSLAPDLEFYLRAWADDVYGHTLAGVFWLDLPLAVGAGVLFHRVMRRPLLAHLPTVLAARLAGLGGETTWPQGRWLVSLGSVLLGIATHLLLDAATHDSGYFVQHWAPLRASAGGIAIYDWLQYGGSLVALLLLVGWVMRLPVQPTVEAPKAARRRFWATVALVTVAATGILVGVLPPAAGPATWIVRLIDAGLLGLLVACVRSDPSQQ